MNSLKKEDIKLEDVMKIKTVVEYIHENYDDILYEYKNDEATIEYFESDYSICFCDDYKDCDDDFDFVPDDISREFVKEYIREKDITIYKLLTELSNTINLHDESQVIYYIFDDYRIEKFEIDTILASFIIAISLKKE